MTFAGQHWSLDTVVDRIGRNDRLGCFVDRLDRLHRLVDDFRVAWGKMATRGKTAPTVF